MKTANGHEIIQLFEEFSPKHLAMEGDPVGLQVGSLNKPIHKVMIALDVLENVVDEAIEAEADLIIAHHPPVFRPLKKIATDLPEGRIIEKLIKHDIAVYAAHTNLDVARGGVNDLLAEALKLEETELLAPTYEEPLKKIAVYVPEEEAEDVRTALGKAGAGALGDYSYCTFSYEGTGRFLPGKDADPYIGNPGMIEAVDEVKIEAVYPARLEKKIVSAMLKAHPYEEVAYDLYKLDISGVQYGLGRIGRLQIEMTLREFADHVKSSLDVEAVRVVGDLNQLVRRVAVLGGDGNKYFRQAKFKGADVFVTGDFYYHNAHDALSIGLSVVDPGHNVEKVMKQGVAAILEKAGADKGYDTEYIVSAINTDPFTFI